MLALGFFMSFIVASAISLRLNGGISHDKVYPIPDVPFTSINGNLDGKQKGSKPVSSYVAIISTLPSNSLNNTSLAKLEIATSRYLGDAASSLDVTLPALPSAFIIGMLLVNF